MFLVEVKIVGIQENKIILLNCTQRGLSPFGSKDAKIEHSGLQSKSEIYAGNPYNISTCYVGGISGWGGNINNCYNNAENIIGNAKYNYETSRGEYTNDYIITVFTQPHAYFKLNSGRYLLFGFWTNQYNKYNIIMKRY